LRGEKARFSLREFSCEMDFGISLACDPCVSSQHLPSRQGETRRLNAHRSATRDRPSSCFMSSEGDLERQMPFLISGIFAGVRQARVSLRDVRVRRCDILRHGRVLSHFAW
jgi:hypothetical protein